MKKLSLTPIMMAVALLASALWTTPTIAAPKDGVHRIVLHLDDNDPKRMNLVLNNAANIDAHYKAKGEEVKIEIVAYGPGLMMLHAKKSPVKKRVTSFGQNFDNISFLACGNTMKKMAKKSGKKVALLPNSKVIPGGVIHLSERQEQGWSYIRP